MSRVTHTTISLPPSRASQLRSIAHAHDCSITDAIELLIRREIKAGRLNDELPGFAAHTEHGHVCLEIGWVGLPPLSPANARVVADFFEATADANAGKPWRKKVELNSGDTHTLSLTRRGAGIAGRVFCDEMEIEQKFSMTRGMARDFARHIRRAANAA